ncbi:sulfurtransferase [Tenacibaculum caenipelagi]|uniref:Thiosulfate/3-mercaptopyruvate sulfurtransferase n=1 Tax=Tenacibaculum caenipelagi TaxID=1325435 RepID=A0A4R6TN65_9FLAO|nr:sulfurtransferase [Tenacibaculum caenipelagi]TDQ29719.1 thiosulfate/3-mercaptopyruvate sulfurtransferase [Tenacibaculum caenipelagi]
MLNINTPIVSVDWLQENLEAKNLIILDATIPKVGATNGTEEEKQQIKNAIFFDLKNVFLDVNGTYPNTIPSLKHFEEQAQKLGVSNDSCIIVYDDLGVYSSPRVWWLFHLYGFKNIAVLNGGLPAWKEAGYEVEPQEESKIKRGDFKAEYQENLLRVTKQVLEASNNKELILDARSKGRFDATESEPREDLRSGHIPNSKSLPYGILQSEGKMKSVTELQQLFSVINPEKEHMTFSCGSGITACILALGAEVSGYTNYSVYDGSWTEWGSRLELPVEK